VLLISKYIAGLHIITEMYYYYTAAASSPLTFFPLRRIRPQKNVSCVHRGGVSSGCGQTRCTVIVPVVTPSYIWRKTQAVSPEVYTQCKECLSLHLHIAFLGQWPACVCVDLCVGLCMFTMCIAAVHQRSSLSSLGFTIHLFPSTSTTHKKQTQLLQPRRHHHHSQ